MSCQENITSDVMSLEDLQNAHPGDARRTFRMGCYFKLVTSGLCRGFIQANIAGIHGSYADDFAEFCRVNEGPLPLLHHSQPGDFSAPPLADDSDIRTDLSAYNVLLNGEYSDIVKDLLPFGDLLNEYAFFYTGCSFSFDKILMDAGINLEYANNPDLTVSMYKTNIQCQPVGNIQGPVVVSMRPIPRDLVQTAVRATHPLRDVHGAPIHIGNPATIGIKDLFDPEYGDPPTTLKDDDVLVYWACGNTIKEVLQQTKHQLSFTMYSDCMYLCDQPSDSTNNVSTNIPNEDQPVVVNMLDEPYTPSLVSERTLEKMANLQMYIDKQTDNTTSKKEDTFIRTCLSLSHARSVGFTVANILQDDMNKTSLIDVLVIASMLQLMGKEVTLFVHDKNMLDMEKLAKCLVEKGIFQKAINLVDSAAGTLTQAGQTQIIDYLVSLNGTRNCEEETFINFLKQAANNLSLFSLYGTQIINGLFDAPPGMYGNTITIALCLLRACPVHDRYRRRGIGFQPSEGEIRSFKNAVLNIEKMTTVLNILKDHKFAENSQDVLGFKSDLNHYLA